jgi:glycosyltransferase involved in cell wall biosynthesis
LKILFVIDSLGSGGGQKQLVELVNNLNSSFDITIFLYNPKSDFFLKKINSKIKIHKVQNRVQKGFSFKVLRDLKFFMDKSDIVISFMLTANIYVAITSLISGKSKRICVERSVSYNSENKLIRFFANLACLRSHLTICNTYTQANYIRTHFGMTKKVLTIWNGITEYDYTHRTFNTTKKLIFVVIARVAYPKNGLRLLQALNIFYERNKFMPSIIWAGRDDISSKLSLLMKQQMISFLNDHPHLKDKFSFVGEQKEINSLYSLADALILPSIYEGLPNAMCEAMMHGCPVIMSKISDNKKILGINEKRGFLCDPFSPLDICMAMERRINISEYALKKMIYNARIFAINYLSISKMVNKYKKVFKNIKKH